MTAITKTYIKFYLIKFSFRNNCQILKKKKSPSKEVVVMQLFNENLEDSDLFLLYCWRHSLRKHYFVCIN